jgi:hypothetical protein
MCSEPRNINVKLSMCFIMYNTIKTWGSGDIDQRILTLDTTLRYVIILTVRNNYPQASPRCTTDSLGGVQSRYDRQIT